MLILLGSTERPRWWRGGCLMISWVNRETQIVKRRLSYDLLDEQRDPDGEEAVALRSPGWTERPRWWRGGCPTISWVNRETQMVKRWLPYDLLGEQRDPDGEEAVALRSPGWTERPRWWRGGCLMISWVNRETQMVKRWLPYDLLGEQRDPDGEEAVALRSPGWTERPRWWRGGCPTIFTNTLRFKVLDQLENLTLVWKSIEIELFLDLAWTYLKDLVS